MSIWSSWKTLWAHWTLLPYVPIEYSSSLGNLQIIVLCVPLQTKCPHSPPHRWLRLHHLLLWYALPANCYKLVTLGLRIDSTITWNWSTIFIPFYIVEAIVAIYVIIDTWTALRRCFRKKAKRSDIEQELNYYDEDSSKDRYLNELEMDPPLVDLYVTWSSGDCLVSRLLARFSSWWVPLPSCTLSTPSRSTSPPVWFPISSLPFWTSFSPSSSMLSSSCTISRICYHLVTILQAVFSIVSLITPLTILFCAMVYDGIVDWSYTQAFIPLWIYFICIAIRDVCLCFLILFNSSPVYWSARAPSNTTWYSSSFISDL